MNTTVLEPGTDVEQSTQKYLAGEDAFIVNAQRMQENIKKGDDQYAILQVGARTVDYMEKNGIDITAANLKKYYDDFLGLGDVPYAAFIPMGFNADFFLNYSKQFLNNYRGSNKMNYALASDHKEEAKNAPKKSIYEGLNRKRDDYTLRIKNVYFEDDNVAGRPVSAEDLEFYQEDTQRFIQTFTYYMLRQTHGWAEEEANEFSARIRRVLTKRMELGQFSKDKGDEQYIEAILKDYRDSVEKYEQKENSTIEDNKKLAAFRGIVNSTEELRNLVRNKNVKINENMLPPIRHPHVMEYSQQMDEFLDDFHKTVYKSDEFDKRRNALKYALSLGVLTKLDEKELNTKRRFASILQKIYTEKEKYEIDAEKKAYGLIATQAIQYMLSQQHKSGEGKTEEMPKTATIVQNKIATGSPTPKVKTQEVQMKPEVQNDTQTKRPWWRLPTYEGKRKSNGWYLAGTIAAYAGLSIAAIATLPTMTAIYLVGGVGLAYLAANEVGVFDADWGKIFKKKAKVEKAPEKEVEHIQTNQNLKGFTAKIQDQDNQEVKPSIVRGIQSAKLDGSDKDAFTPRGEGEGVDFSELPVKKAPPVIWKETGIDHPYLLENNNLKEQKPKKPRKKHWRWEKMEPVHLLENNIHQDAKKEKPTPLTSEEFLKVVVGKPPFEVDSINVNTTTPDVPKKVLKKPIKVKPQSAKTVVNDTQPKEYSYEGKWLQSQIKKLNELGKVVKEEDNARRAQKVDEARTLKRALKVNASDQLGASIWHKEHGPETPSFVNDEKTNEYKVFRHTKTREYNGK
ncbi:MAG: hypothetical protein LBU87_05740 [Lactobacillales bacterium]|nr:hypothetical protein [Lactobacillales bacterium]